MKNKIFSTGNDWSGLITRLTVGIILLPHGAQKLFGIFGGYGFSGTMGYFTDALHLPWIVGFLVIFLEFFGSVALIAGFASRIWAGAILVLMVGIILTSHLDNGFFMNWFGNQKGEGFEFHLLVIGLCAAIIVTGSGPTSIDRLIQKSSKQN